MRRLLIVLLASYSATLVATPVCSELPNTAGFIVGRYEMLARDPDSMNTYTSNVVISSSKDEKSITLVQTRSSKPKRTWKGYFRVASPGEGCVLALESAPYLSSCLVQVDLDNNARLTCRWGLKDSKVPGIAALFPAVKR